MVAFLVCLGALSYWAVVGYGFLSFFAARRRATLHLLLAPAFGLALTVCCLFVANRAGLPLRVAGWPVSVGLLLLSGLALWRRRPPFPLRRLAPFLALVLLPILLIGWPMARFGFDWVSYANDDLANYALYAKCLLDHGWHDPIAVSDLAEGREGSRSFVFLYTLTGYRPGAEILMAWLSSLTGKTTLDVAMPLVLAMNSALVAASGALVYRGRSRRLAALATCALVGLSAPLAMGVLNQLMGQGAGLTVLCAAAVMLLRPARERRWTHLAKRSVLLGVILAGVVVCYCELLPFLVVGYAVYAGVVVLRRRWRWRSAALTLSGAALIVLAVMQNYLQVALGFLLIQVGQGARVKQALAELFPYYLHPTGLASLWSFQPFHQNLPEPWLSIAIVTGLVLLLLSAFFAARLAWRAQPVAIVCGVMFAVAAVFYVQGSAFGLYKLVMYLQPFLLGTLALAWARLGKWRWAALVPMFAFAYVSAKTQHAYSAQSFGIHTLCEEKSASEDAVYRRLRGQLRRCDADHLIVATDSSFTTKIIAMSNDGRPLRTPIYPFFYGATISWKNPLRSRNYADRLEQLSAAVGERFPSWDFDLHDPANPGRVNRFVSVEAGAMKPSRPAVILSSGKVSVLNRHRLPEETTKGLYVRPLAEIHDHLVLVDSERGRQYFMALGAPDVAMFQLEGDYFRPGHTIASLGRDLLFEVLEPTPRARMLVDVTTSLAANGDCRLPEAAVIGQSRVGLPLTGRGAARVIAEPVEPQAIAGNHYLALDLGERKFQFRPRPSRWDRFSHSVVVDRRRLTAFGRDVSLLSEAEYASLNPPAMLTSFPADLAHPDLEFSGVYEDGWLSEHAWFRPSSGCRKGETDVVLVVEGMVPEIADANFRTSLVVRVEGREVVRRDLPLGDFTIREVLSNLPSRPKVELIFSDTQRLPDGDDRVVVGQVRRVGFEPVQTTRTARAK